MVRQHRTALFTHPIIAADCVELILMVRQHRTALFIHPIIAAYCVELILMVRQHRTALYTHSIIAADCVELILMVRQHRTALYTHPIIAADCVELILMVRQPRPESLPLVCRPRGDHVWRAEVDNADTTVAAATYHKAPVVVHVAPVTAALNRQLVRRLTKSKQECYLKLYYLL